MVVVVVVAVAVAVAVAVVVVVVVVVQFVIFKSLSYCFEETIGFDVKVSFASRPVSRLIS